ncbi:unnamed protein product [Protopolystoma xenopodis]|uniref:Uncharacterized protein n=1 Tax=Protopolystoma xenopodis TaxID=117903 RepID=A0A3S4ZVH5_9PLAT|nr:unnamed protein product [Protopolystoma xenopodis]
MKDCTMTEAPSIASRKQTSAEGQALEAYLQDVSVYSQTNQLSGFIDSGNHFINGVTSLSQDIETPNRDQALSPKSESLYAPNLCEISYEKLHQPQFGMISPSKIKKNINKFVQTNRNCTMSFEVPHNKFTESSHRNSSQLIPTEKQTKPIRGQQLLLLSQGEDSGNDQKTGNIPTFQSNAFTTTRCSSGGPLDVRSDTLMFHHHHPKKKLMKQVADVSIFRTPVQSIECPCPSPPVRNGVETTRNQLSKQLYKIRTELPSTGFAAQSNRSMAPSSLGDIIPMSYNTTNESFPHIYSRHSPTAKTDFFVAGKADKLSLVEGRRRKSFGSAFYPQPIELCTNGSSVSGAAARLSEHASDGEEQNDKVSESYEKMVPQKKRGKIYNNSSILNAIIREIPNKKE